MNLVLEQLQGWKASRLKIKGADRRMRHEKDLRYAVEIRIRSTGGIRVGLRGRETQD